MEKMDIREISERHLYPFNYGSCRATHSVSALINPIFYLFYSRGKNEGWLNLIGASIGIRTGLVPADFVTTTTFTLNSK